MSPRVTKEWTVTGGHGVSVGCAHSGDFETLPPTLTYKGRVYGKGCWNHKAKEAYYRTDSGPMAIPVGSPA
jgi:hypothetical protein